MPSLDNYRQNIGVRADRAICRLIPTPLLKEYYCRIMRKLAIRGIFENNAQIITSDGFLMNANKSDGISWRIYYTGFHERSIGDVIRNTLKEGDVFVDVGANIGYFTIMAAKAVGVSGNVVSFEASPNTAKILKKNLDANQLRNVDVRNIAISDKVGMVKIFGSGPENLGQKSILENRGNVVEAEVPCRPLSSDTLGVDIRRIRLIKIDVEGAESFVVAGMIGLLDEPGFNSDIILEIAPQDLDVPVAEFLEPFTSRGYKVVLVPNKQRLRHYFERAEEMNFVAVAPSSIISLSDVLLTRRLS
jgi:FkbM family methyltransferase